MSQTIQVNANVASVDSGISLRREEQITLSASGQVTHHDSGGNNGLYGPEGTGGPCSPCIFPTIPLSALLGWIGTEDGRENPFKVTGTEQTFTANQNGTLYFAVNDHPNAHHNNVGNFTVTVKGWGRIRLISSSGAGTGAGGAGAGTVEQLLDNPTVELIVDASGSMKENKMGEETYWTVAKRVLTKVIDDDLNESMHVALRVFGPTLTNPTQAGSGVTNLVQPLGALNKTTLKTQINNMTPSSYTPIAASIKLVQDDLQTATGARSVVVLITDGNENCGGDVKAEINALNASGVDVVLNVIGFGISDANLKAKFTEWAQAGNGTYYDATDPQLFEQELIKAINVPYMVKPVRSRGGRRGYIDGPAIFVPAGSYSITVDPDDVDYLMNIGQHVVNDGQLTEIQVQRW